MRSASILIFIRGFLLAGAVLLAQPAPISWAAPAGPSNTAAPTSATGACAAMAWNVTPLAGGQPMTLGAIAKPGALPVVIYVFTPETPKAAEALTEMAGLPPSQYRAIPVAVGGERDREKIAQWAARLSLPTTMFLYLAQPPVMETTVLPVIYLCSPDGAELRRQRGWSRGIRKMMNIAETPAAVTPAVAVTPTAAIAPGVPVSPIVPAVPAVPVAPPLNVAPTAVATTLSAMDLWPTNTVRVAAREGADYEEIFPAGVKMKMIWIKAGSFEMGSPPFEAGRFGNEGPAHIVELDGFWIGETEVTQAQYYLLTGKHISHWQGPNLPAEQTPWDSAVKFCDALTAKSGMMNIAYRLPTEAQWEYVCRAGGQSRFGFGNTDAELAAWDWIAPNSGSVTHVVKTMRPNAWGVYDMHGNVSEWCLDWYKDSYAEGKQKNPTGPPDGMERVIRGGSACDDASRCRSAKRNRSLPSLSYGVTGFRVVAVPVKK